MHYLFKDKKNIQSHIGRKRLFLFLDYDGTLTPIVQTPQQAVLSHDIKTLLKRLTKKCDLAIISGRSLKDVKKRVGIKGIFYAGNHGWEIEGRGIRFKSRIVPRLKKVLQHIRDGLKSKLSGIKGVFVEDKGLSLSVHYRLADKKDIGRIRNSFDEVTHFFLIRKKIKGSLGKKVFEVRPPLAWDKGTVVLWLLSAQKSILKKGAPYPVYLGDDVTDEDAFKALKKKGLGIFVGRPKDSYARFYLKGPHDVKKFLEQILAFYQKENV